MVSFRARFTAGLEQRGIQVCTNLDDTPYDAVLVIGGTRDLLGLRQVRRRGVRIVQRLNGMNWIHRKRRTGLKHALRSEYGNLILNTIRWASEIRPVSELKLPPAGKAATTLKPGELKMAAQLISSMTGKWEPADYTENFSAAVHKLVNRKIKAGETESVTPVEDASTEERSSNVIDLTELLAKSLKRRTDTADKSPPSAKPKGAPPSKKTAAKAPSRKRA